MTDRTATLKQLVADSSYPMDEAAVAEAILMRSLRAARRPGDRVPGRVAPARACARFARTATRGRFASRAPSGG